MIIISTSRDLETYLHDARPDLGIRTHEVVRDAIQEADHPAWGKDWEAWLAANVPAIVADVAGALR